MGRFFGVETNDKRFNDSGKIKCFVSLQKSKDRCKYLNNYEFTEKNTFWKVITAEANGKSPKFGEKFIGTPNEVHTGSYISFRVANEEEAKSLLSYLETKFANHMLSVRKISQHINGDVCKWIPLVPLDRIWTDDAVCEYLKIDQTMYI
jgi:site-specific DNA-methyltransferase (adenine-specific)